MTAHNVFQYYKKCDSASDIYGVLAFISTISDPKRPEYMSLIREWARNCHIAPELWLQYYSQIPNTSSQRGHAARKAMRELVQFQTINMLRSIQIQSPTIFDQLKVSYNFNLPMIERLLRKLSKLQSKLLPSHREYMSIRIKIQLLLHWICCNIHVQH